jgi:hypothetical protein
MIGHPAAMQSNGNLWLNNTRHFIFVFIATGILLSAQI